MPLSFARMMVSVVIPALNEESNVGVIADRLRPVLERCADDYEIIFVDDCSQDGTLAALRRMAASDPRVRFISLSRRFGHEIAIAAGLDRAVGEAVVMMDADLQDPPEVVEQLIAKWRDGADVAYARRRTRRGDSFFKRAFAHLFYRLLARVSEVDIPADTGNFRLMDRRVVEVVRNCRERTRFVRGLVPWAGFKQEPVDFDRDPRRDGRTGYSAARMFRLAGEAMLAFAGPPVRLCMWSSAAMITVSVAIAAIELLRSVVTSAASSPRGFALLGALVLFVAGVQLLILGTIAAYVGAIFKNVQGRPLYVVAEESRMSETAHRKPEIIVTKDAISRTLSGLTGPR